MEGRILNLCPRVAQAAALGGETGAGGGLILAAATPGWPTLVPSHPLLDLSCVKCKMRGQSRDVGSMPDPAH